MNLSRLEKISTGSWGIDWRYQVIELGLWPVGTIGAVAPEGSGNAE